MDVCQNVVKSVPGEEVRLRPPSGRDEVSFDWRECPSRHNECYDAVADDPAVDVFAGHQLNDGPFLPKESRRLVYVQGVYLDTTRPPSTAVRHLKKEGIAFRFPSAINQRSFLSHSLSP